MIIPHSNGEPELGEHHWTDAAREAVLAARRAKAARASIVPAAHRGSDRRRLLHEVGGDMAILRLIEGLMARVGGVDLREVEGTELTERWSDAARAAAIAARRAKRQGKDWRKAGRKAFLARLSPSARAYVTRGEISAGDRKVAAHRAARYASKPGSWVARRMQQEFERERGERKAARFAPKPRIPQALMDLW